MKLNNLDEVIRLKKSLQDVDKEIACLNDKSKSEATFHFSLGDHRCGSTHFKQKVLDGTVRTKMIKLINEGLTKQRQIIISNLISLGVQP